MILKWNTQFFFPYSGVTMSPAMVTVLAVLASSVSASNVQFKNESTMNPGSSCSGTYCGKLWWFLGGSVTTLNEAITTSTSGGGNGGGDLCVDPNGFYPHPTDCQKYYQCAHGTPYEYSCASGLLWNDSTKKCEFAENVQCTTGTTVSAFRTSTASISPTLDLVRSWNYLRRTLDCPLKQYHYINLRQHFEN